MRRHELIELTLAFVITIVCAAAITHLTHVHHHRHYLLWRA